MSFCFGFKEESKTKAVGGKQHQFFVGAFVPLFVLLGGSGFQSDSGAFSELGGMPPVAVSEVAEAPMEVSSISVEAVEDPALIRCRWQADRQLLANIGKSATDEGIIDCSVYEKTASSGTTGKREIREKVIALSHRNKFDRADQTTGGVLPAQQCLGLVDSASGQVHNRLVHHAKLLRH